MSVSLGILDVKMLECSSVDGGVLGSLETVEGV